MSTMTREEFYKKYAGVEFKLDSYFKYVFTFIGKYDGVYIYVNVGGNPDEIYRQEFYADSTETIGSLQPFSGSCGEDKFCNY
jgi:hypothetical protein